LPLVSRAGPICSSDNNIPFWTSSFMSIVIWNINIELLKIIILHYPVPTGNQRAKDGSLLQKPLALSPSLVKIGSGY
jgi:hypothetical protein